MISSTLKVIGCLFTVCLIVHAQNPAQKTQPSSISGKVTLKGNGVAGIVVGARPAQQSGGRRILITATTDQQGNYRLPNVPPGHYEVIPAAPQFVLANQMAVKTLVVGDGETLENVDFTLVRGGVITGKVADADGRPMVEEPVEVFAVGGTDAKPTVLMNIFADPTDDRGVYRIYGLRPGKYRVAVGTSEDRLAYGRGRAVYGRTYYPSTSEESEATLIEVTEGSEATNVDITLRRTLSVYTVYARVVDETGKPMANVVYGLQRFLENGSWSTSGSPTNSRGEIKIDSVTPGKYALFLEPTRSGGVYAEPLRFEVVDQDVKDLVIKASSGASVSGVVVFDGFELTGTARQQLIVMARVEVKERGDFIGSSPNGMVNADGSFTVGGLRPGNAHFAIWARNQGPSIAYEITQMERDGVAQQSLEIKAGEQIKNVRLIVKARTGRIRGVVKFENSPILNTRAHVMVTKVGENSGMMLQLDERGRFVSDPMLAGVYDVRVIVYPAQGRSVSAKQQVAVTDNQVTEVMLTVDMKADTGRP